MNKQEIQQQIKEARKRHSAELKALEAKLNEPEKWEPKGGIYRVYTSSEHCLFMSKIDRSELVEETMLRAQTKEEAEALAAHLKRQAILWQLANDLNKGWKPDCSLESHGGYEVFLNFNFNKWLRIRCGSTSMPSAIFKDEETAAKACEILNNQPELMQ